MERIELLKGYGDRHILFGLFFAFGNRLQAAGDTFYEEITCKQFFLLICLTLFRKEAPTMKALAEVMGSSHQNVKQIVNKLEKSGFVHVIQDESDRRKLRVIPTKKLDWLGKKYSEMEDAFMKKLYCGLTEEEIAVTLRSMTKMEKNLIAIKEGI